MGQLKVGKKILFLTVLIYAEEISKNYTQKKLQPVVNLCIIIAVSTNTKGVENLKPKDI